MDPREAIIKTAIRDFSQHGIAAVSWQELAFDASVSVAEISRIFHSKDELVEAIIAYIPLYLESYEPTREELLEQCACYPPERILERYANRLYWLNDPLLPFIYRLAYIEQYTNPKILAFTHDYFVYRSHRRLQTVLDVLQEQTRIPPCNSAALAELWLRTGLVFNMLLLHDPKLVDRGLYQRVNRFLLQLARCGVRPVPLADITASWARRPARGTGRRIKDCSFDLLAQGGEEGDSMRRLSEQINRKKSVIVSYYGSKAELMAEIVADILLGFEHDQNPSAACMLEPQQMALAFGAPYPLACEECVNKNYRALFREQYSQQALRNSFTSAFIREYDQVQRVFEELAGQRKQPAGDYRAAAVVFVHGMCSLTIGQTVSAQEQFLKLEERRLHIAAILVSYLLYGLAQPWT